MQVETRSYHVKIIPSEIKDHLHYDPDTGNLMWVKGASGRISLNTPLRSLNSSGYIVVKFQQVLYQAHRVAWFIHTGTQPSDELDHINGIKHDNRIVNLREATRNENRHNIPKRSNNTSGYKGVNWNKPVGKWQARIMVNKVNRNLGHFDNVEEAYAAYCKAAKELHKNFYCI